MGLKKPRKKKASILDQSKSAALKVRDAVAAKFVPLFDHLLNLGDSDRKSYEEAEASGANRSGAYGYHARRAGRMYREAKEMARKYPKGGE